MSTAHPPGMDNVARVERTERLRVKEGFAMGQWTTFILELDDAVPGPEGAPCTSPTTRAGCASPDARHGPRA